MTHAALNAIATDLVTHLWEQEPLEATLTGFREYDARLSDLSIAAETAARAQRHDLRKRTLEIGTAELEGQDLHTRAVILSVLENLDSHDIAGQIAFTVTDFPIAPASSLLAYLRMVRITNDEEAAAYLQRLEAIPEYLVHALHRLAVGRAHGLTPVAHLVEAAMRQIDRYLAAAEDPLLTPFPPDWDESEGWLEQARAVLEDRVHPAFAAYRRALADAVLPTARDRERVGLCHLPQGEARYEALIGAHTTTRRTAAELHATGLAQVAQVQAEFRELGERCFGISDLQALFAHLQHDPALRWSARADILAAAESAVRRAEAAAPKWFGRLPASRCEIEEIPDLEAQGSAPAYYMGPALDGSRPGTYFQNTYQPTERTSFDLESIAYHEAVPGHHFQISIAQELPDLPLIRRLTMFTAYAEGWGLYAERLADEMGLYSSDVQRIGMLAADAWRASRLVVDTGMHALGWSREQALEYLLQNTPIARIDAESEIDRYIAFPGQALSYMTGRLEFERLRAAAEQALGDRFDLKAFHDEVLGNGALPLSVLSDVVQEWIDRQ